ncbi:MAG: T9SS type A sorting domain-containing protein [Fibrobacteria bacterium]|nr:T9SS type A sorting domain-containing protein [Fibrobacteria bacterium]
MLKNLKVFLCAGMLFMTSIGFANPSWKVEEVRPAAMDWAIGAMDFMSDGRLVVASWKDNYSIHFVEGVTGDPANMVMKTYAEGFREILGMQVVNDSIYVLTKNALMLLLDHDNNGKADEFRVITYDWNRTTNEKNYAFGMPYNPIEHCFYACFNGDLMGAATLRDPHPPGRENSCFKIFKDGRMDIISGGHRVPAGVDYVYGELWVTENQGGYRPSSPILNVRQDRWYGRQVKIDPLPFLQPHTKTPTTPYSEYSAFAVRLIHQINARSPGNTVGIYSGIFKGQMFVCDADMYKEIGTGGIRRVFVELVDGEYQGCVIDFKRQGEFKSKGIWKLRWGLDNNLYAGGCASNGGMWKRDTPLPGLARITPSPTDSITFEILAVRSMGSDKFQIEFTKPVVNAPGSDMKADLTIKRQSFELQDAYGGGEGPEIKLTITSAIVSSDQKKLDIVVPGLVKRDNYNFELLDNKVYAKDDNSELLNRKAWYTLNNFGPGTSVPDSLIDRKKDYIVGINTPKSFANRLSGKFKMTVQKKLNGDFLIDVKNIGSSENYTLRVVDILGREIIANQGKGPGQKLLKSSAFASGVYVVYINVGNASVSQLIMR